ncbi:type I glyceraldehyde-3-phosphate dehydrogenase [Pikeienuella sp. HZG-20]|uniref:type I glyceraldehyde-3-phosphate dehydrogenase n=1 Tax=Paludibacillus litoralis TaxID=3133267 RepID=UPI0030EE7825
MSVRAAINGFGRIGRNVLRSIVESGRDDIEIVAINDLGPIETNAHLLRFDSVHGRFPRKVEVVGGGIDIGYGPIRVTALRDPKELPWADVDVALECTGVFKDREKAERHLQNGSRRVLISAPGDGADRTVVYGVNHADLRPADRVISNASCTTNCLAPLAMVMDEAFGLMKGHMVTVHSYTGDQPILDKLHRDLYRSRAAAMSMVPTSTGAVSALKRVLPNLADRIDGASVRVPTPNVSLVDLTFLAGRKVTVDEVNAAAKAASEGPLKGVFVYDEAPKVSIDYNHDGASASFAANETSVVGGDFVRVVAWYDNEWGFSCRMADIAALVGRLG